MTVSLHSIPDDVISTCVLPHFKVENPLRLNEKIRQEAQNFSRFAKICRRFNGLVQEHLKNLKKEHTENLEKGLQVQRSIGDGIIQSSLHVCALKGDNEGFLAILRAGLEDVNIQDRCRITALHHAARLENRELVVIILSHPLVNPHIPARNGKTPAEFTKNAEIKKLLPPNPDHPLCD